MNLDTQEVTYEWEEYDLNFPVIEGLGKKISYHNDGSKITGRRGAKSNLNHNSTLRKYINRVYRTSKRRFQEIALRNNFLDYA